MPNFGSGYGAFGSEIGTFRYSTGMLKYSFCGPHLDIFNLVIWFPTGVAPASPSTNLIHRLRSFSIRVFSGVCYIIPRSSASVIGGSALSCSEAGHANDKGRLRPSRPPRSAVSAASLSPKARFHPGDQLVPAKPGGEPASRGCIARINNALLFLSHVFVFDDGIRR